MPQAQQQLLEDPSKLIALANPTLFALFKAGAHLKVWRNSTPHNWWLEDQKTREILHHWDEREIPGKAFRALARCVETSDEMVSYGGWMRGSDAGMPVSQSWAYDATVHQALQLQWANAIAQSRELNVAAGTKPLSLVSLTAPQRALLRQLKRRCMLLLAGMAREDAAVFCAMGLAVARPEGWLYATDALADLRIPREAAE